LANEKDRLDDCCWKSSSLVSESALGMIFFRGKGDALCEDVASGIEPPWSSDWAYEGIFESIPSLSESVTRGESAPLEAGWKLPLETKYWTAGRKGLGVSVLRRENPENLNMKKN
jgi:hypothetical protein